MKKLFATIINLFRVKNKTKEPSNKTRSNHRPSWMYKNE